MPMDAGSDANERPHDYISTIFAIAEEVYSKEPLRDLTPVSE